MPFWVVSGVGRRMSLLDGDGDRRRRRGSLGVNLGRHTIATSGVGDAIGTDVSPIQSHRLRTTLELIPHNSPIRCE